LVVISLTGKKFENLGEVRFFLLNTEERKKKENRKVRVVYKEVLEATRRLSYWHEGVQGEKRNFSAKMGGGKKEISRFDDFVTS